MLSLAHELRENDSYTLPDRTRLIFTTDHRSKPYLQPYQRSTPWWNRNQQTGRRRRTHRTAEGPRHLHGDAGVSFICSDEVTIAGSVVYVLEFYRSSKGGNCSRCCQNYRMEQPHVCLSRRGSLQNRPNGPVFFSSLAGTRGDIGERVYEFSHLQQGFAPWDNELRDFV
jgi:hypothetical protein